MKRSILTFDDLRRKGALVLLSAVALATAVAQGGPGPAGDVARDGFTAVLSVDCTDVRAPERLYTCGALSVSLRLAGEDRELLGYDRAGGNYVNFPMPDGRCPVIEATICRLGGRVGVPLSLFAATGGVHRVTVHYDGVHVSLLAGDQMDDDLPTAKECPVVWPSDAKENRHSPRVREAAFASPARRDVLPVPQDARPIAGTAQYWTPPAFNAWVGDVSVGVWRGRFHVFYLYDRRHHGSGAGTGRHYFAHISSPDLSRWDEHPHAVPIERWWECEGTGTPFAHQGKLCLAYGLHTSRVADGGDLVYAHMSELPEDRRGEGRFRFSDLPKYVPVGGTYAESDDGIHFRKTGIFITWDQNPSVYVRDDGKLGLATGGGQLYVARGDGVGPWVEDGACAPAGGDCPAPFSWGDRDYLLQGFYWMASRPKGGAWENWTATDEDVYDGLGVPMVAAWGNDRRILVGWLRHVYGWGGWLCFRELVRFPDGKLGIRWLPETPPPVEPAVFRVTDANAPFVLRAQSEKTESDVEFRIDPKEARAQFSFPGRKAPGARARTAAEILAARPAAERFVARNQKGPFAFKNGETAIARIRGLDKPFEVRFVQYYDRKSDATIFDAEIAGTRTLITRAAGRFAPVVRR